MQELKGQQTVAKSHALKSTRKTKYKLTRSICDIEEGTS